MFTFKQLESAVDIVQDELIQHYFWDEKLSTIDVIWVPYGSSYGWQHYLGSGDIKIPAFSRSKLVEMLFGGGYFSLKDILRHEYAHAFAHTHRGLIRSSLFKSVYGSHHDDEKITWEYNSLYFVSEYAATNTSEDFAETFRYYLNYSGVLPLKFKTPIIKAKWNFIKELSKANKQGKTRFY